MNFFKSSVLYINVLYINLINIRFMRWINILWFQGFRLKLSNWNQAIYRFGIKGFIDNILSIYITLYTKCFKLGSFPEAGKKKNDKENLIITAIRWSSFLLCEYSYFSIWNSQSLQSQSFRLSIRLPTFITRNKKRIFNSSNK